MPRQASRAKQVANLGETPAEARARMTREAAAEVPTQTVPPEADVPVEGPVEVEGDLTPLQIAEIHAKVGGFQGEAVSGGVTETRGDREDLPSPGRAMDMIREQANKLIQLTEERDAALNLVAQYRAQFGELG